MTLAGKLFDRFEDLCAAIAALLVVYVMLTISADVVGRYFLHRPIGWAIEFAEHALMALPFLSMAWLVRENGHVIIDVVVRLLPELLRRWLEVFVALLAAATTGFACWFAVLTTLSLFRRGVKTIGIYPVDRYLLIAVVAFGLGLASIEFLRLAGRRLREIRR